MAGLLSRPIGSVIVAVLVPSAAALAQGITNYNVEYVDDANTVGLWHFNGDTVNSAAASAGIPPLTLQGPTAATGAGGKFAGALSVGGATGGAFILDEGYPQLDVALFDHSFTLECWLRPTAADLDPVTRPVTDLLAHYKRFNTPDIYQSGRGFNVRILNNVQGEGPGLLYARYGDPGEVVGAAYGTIVTDRGLGQLAGFDRSVFSDTPLIADQWNHVAVTRDGPTWRMYVNGAIVAETQSDHLPGASGEPLILGASDAFTGIPFVGMMDEVRISKVARDPRVPGYLDSAFADDADTVGLWHFDGDGHNAAATASSNADFLLKPNATFSPIDGRFGGGLVLNGGAESSSAAYINNSDIPELNAAIAQGQVVTKPIGLGLFPAKTISIAPDLTIEGWVKPTEVDVTTSSSAGILAKYFPTSSNREFELRIDSNAIGTAQRRTATKGLPFMRFGDVSLQTTINTGASSILGVGLLGGDPASAGYPETPFPAGAWSHVAVTRANNVFTMWFNGQAVATITSFYGIANSGQPLIFGRMGGSFLPLQGMLDEVRISKIARNPGAGGYLAAPFADDADTVGLWHFDGSGANAHVGASATATVTAQNGAAFTGADGKFGGALQVAGGNGIIADADIPELDAAISGGTTQETGPSLAAGAWTHVAITRGSGTYKMWVNGTVVSQSACGIAPTDGTEPLYFGAREAGSLPLTGMIDEVRISRVARDLSVVPSAPYADDRNTVGLWHFDGNGSNSAVTASPAAVVSLQGGATFATAGGKFGGALQVAGGYGFINDADIPELDAALGSGDFTIEFFVNPASGDVTGTNSPGLLAKYLTGNRAEETLEIRLDNAAAGTDGRPSALKGVPYFRTGEGVGIANQCAEEVVSVQAPSFTLELWVKPVPEDLQPVEGAAGQGRGLMVHYYPDDANLARRSFSLSINNYPLGEDGRLTDTKGLVQFRTGDAHMKTEGRPTYVGLISGQEPTLVRRTGAALQADVWNHVAVTRLYDPAGPDTWRMWIGDKLVSEVMADAPLPDSFEPFVVGAGEDNSPLNSPGTDWQNPLHGMIDELRVSDIARAFGRTSPANPADFDADGDVDLEDFTRFVRCFNGPNRPVATDCTDDADFDADADVDLEDFTAFTRCFNGPNRPPSCE